MRWRPVRQRGAAPCGESLGGRLWDPTRQQNGLRVIVIDRVMAVAMHRPEQVFMKPVGMPVTLNHFGVFLECFNDLWHMRTAGGYAPDHHCRTGQQDKHPPRRPCHHFARSHGPACLVVPTPCGRRIARFCAKACPTFTMNRDPHASPAKDLSRATCPGMIGYTGMDNRSPEQIRSLAGFRCGLTRRERLPCSVIGRCLTRSRSRAGARAHRR